MCMSYPCHVQLISACHVQLISALMKSSVVDWAQSTNQLTVQLIHKLKSKNMSLVQFRFSSNFLLLFVSFSNKSFEFKAVKHTRTHTHTNTHTHTHKAASYLVPNSARRKARTCFGWRCNLKKETTVQSHYKHITICDLKCGTRATEQAA